MAISDDELDDFEEAETEEFLRRKLGDQCTDDIIRRVLDAEKTAAIRRESLVDMLDTGILEAAEYADKVNLVASALLRDVAAMVGPELCRRIYDVDPDEKPVLVDPRLMGRSPRVLTSQILAEIAVSEWLVERANLHVECDETDFAKDLYRTIVFMSAKADVSQVMSRTTQETLLYWQAAFLSCFVASRHSGGGVGRVVWRISDRILGTADRCLVPTQKAVTEYFELLPEGLSAGNREMARLRSMLDMQDDSAINNHEAVALLRKHAMRVGQTEIRVPSAVNDGGVCSSGRTTLLLGRCLVNVWRSVAERA